MNSLVFSERYQPKIMSTEYIWLGGVVESYAKVNEDQSAAGWCLKLLPSGSDIVSQCALIVRDAFAADHADPPSHSVGHHTCMDSCHTQRRGLQNERRGQKERWEILVLHFLLQQIVIETQTASCVFVDPWLCLLCSHEVDILWFFRETSQQLLDGLPRNLVQI